MKQLIQTNLFGGGQEVNTRPHPNDLPRPINDWALSIYIVLNHPKGVTVFDAMKNYGMVKFQERLNEVLSLHPQLVAKDYIKVRKRLNREVTVMRYKVVQIGDSIDLYMTEINKKGWGKSLKTK
jgi:hypothetical protein